MFRTSTSTTPRPRAPLPRVLPRLVQTWARDYLAHVTTAVQASPATPPQVPADVGAHPGFGLEWWYYHGHLEEEEAAYGFHVAFFRVRLPPRARLGLLPIGWLRPHLYVAHFGITDERSGRYSFAETSNLPWLWRGQARAGSDYRLRLGDWRIEGVGGGLHDLYIATADCTLALTLGGDSRPTLHGQQGVVEMGQGGPSYYLSHPRLHGQGGLLLRGRSYNVQCPWAWMDHQWGNWTWRGHVWDWFGLRLANGGVLMLFLFRDRATGTLLPQSGGSYLAPGKSAPTPLAATEVQVTVQQGWTSPATGRRYPAQWLIQVPAHRLRLHVRPTVAAQEAIGQLAPPYWEGSVLVDGSANGQHIAGTGYVELVGYTMPNGAGGGPCPR